MLRMGVPGSRGEIFSIVFLRGSGILVPAAGAKFSLHSVPASWDLKAKRNTSICRQKALSQAVWDIQSSRNPLLRSG